MAARERRKIRARVANGLPTAAIFLSRAVKGTKLKEPTVRSTVNLTESMHRKLSILARTGKKKAEIVRMLLDEALQEVIE